MFVLRLIITLKLLCNAAMTTTINLVVGGTYFSIDIADLAPHLDSYFSMLLKDEWTNNNGAPVILERDAESFRYVQHYLFTGELGHVTRLGDDVGKLLRIKREADFYNLPKLVALCDDRLLDSFINTCRGFKNDDTNQLTYDCVVETFEGSADALVAALRPLRTPIMATARLDSYMKDRLIHDSIDEFLKEIRWLPSNHLDENFVKCKQLSIQEIEAGTYAALQETFSSISPSPVVHVNKSGLKQSYPSVYAYREGGMCLGYTPISQCTGHVVYIFNTVHTGGRVTSVVNGETVSIEQSGEYISIILGATYKVEKVTSGVLVLVVFPIYADFTEAVVRENQSQLRVFPATCASLTVAHSEAILHAVAQDLQEYDGVVLCLSNYYPPRISEEEDRSLETDVNLLNEMELSLHALCAQDYDVSVVTVYVRKEEPIARVLDFTLPVGSNDTLRYKVVAPVFGCGKIFPTDFYPTDLESYGTLLTGLFVTTL